MRRLRRAVPATAAVNPVGGYVILIIAATGGWAVHGPMCAPASQHIWLSVFGVLSFIGGTCTQALTAT